MAVVATQIQAVAALLDYTFDYDDAPWLAPGDYIVASSWAVTPSGPVLSLPTFDDTSTTVRVTGGAAGTDYTVTNTITTSRGLIYPRSFTLQVR